MAGKLTARDFDKVHFGDFTGSINATGIGNAGIESFTAGNVTGATLSAAGRVSQVSVQQWSGGSLTADTFGALSFTGKGGGTGDLKNTTVKVTGAGLNSGITKITAKGSLASLIIDAGPAYIGSIKADEWVSGSLTAQGLAGLDLDGDKARSVRGDLSGVTIRLFDPNTTLAKAEIAGFIIGSAVAGAPPTIQTDGKIGLLQCLGMENATIKVQGGLGLNKLWIKGTETGKNFFIASNVTATQIGTVILNNVKTSNGGTAFGITAAAIAKYLRKTNGIVDEAETGLNPSKSPFDVDVDYRVLLKANPFT